MLTYARPLRGRSLKRPDLGNSISLHGPLLSGFLQFLMHSLEIQMRSLRISVEICKGRSLLQLQLEDSTYYKKITLGLGVGLIRRLNLGGHLFQTLPAELSIPLSIGVFFRIN